MEPLHQFVIDLEQFIKERGYEIQTNNIGDADLTDLRTGKFVGWWTGYMTEESFREVKR